MNRQRRQLLFDERQLMIFNYEKETTYSRKDSTQFERKEF